ncbi:MAG: hypothetical protein SCARUB_02072 [Candidatus Scalindua rubra]|uniref:HTH cro/C1-type domain-containing protein n=1 Tax=Candidatus Scalindua rubra TaxID=1872076 RepID=A0A1E3XB12_9BACT|nr:MAG: hypothetical protein SCARUB_02072 [Candidatus Scalindua rubra]
MMIGVSVSTLQNWEQGRRKPEGSARALLKIASENPKADPTRWRFHSLFFALKFFK